MKYSTHSLSADAEEITGAVIPDEVLKANMSALSDVEFSIVTLYYEQGLTLVDIAELLDLTNAYVIDNRQYALIRLCGMAGYCTFLKKHLFCFEKFQKYSAGLCTEEALRNILPYLPQKTAFVVDYLYLQDRDLYDVCFAASLSPREVRTLCVRAEDYVIRALQDATFISRNKHKAINIVSGLNTKYGTAYTNRDIQAALAKLSARHQNIAYSYFVQHKEAYTIKGTQVTLRSGLDMLYRDLHQVLLGNKINSTVSILNWISECTIGKTCSEAAWRNIFNCLPLQSKKILLSSLVDKKTYPEIGKELGISKQRVEQVRSKTLKRLFNIALSYAN